MVMMSATILKHDVGNNIKVRPKIIVFPQNHLSPSHDSAGYARFPAAEIDWSGTDIAVCHAKQSVNTGQHIEH